MNLSQTWCLGSRTDSLLNQLYDRLRQRLNRRLFAFLVAQLPRDAKGAIPNDLGICVLEAGSGTGYCASLFSASSAVNLCVCLDLDEQALQRARARAPGIPAVVGDLRRLPFRNDAFTLVFNSSTLEHIDPCSDVVGEMNRVCRADGKVFIGVPYRFGPLAFQPLIRRTSLGIWLGDVFGKSSLAGLLRAQGLSPVRFIRYFGWFFLGVLAVKSSVQARSAWPAQ